MLYILDSLRGSSVNIGTIQRILAWPLRRDDTHKSRSVNNTIREALYPPSPHRWRFLNSGLIVGRGHAFKETACDITVTITITSNIIIYYKN